MEVAERAKQSRKSERDSSPTQQGKHPAKVEVCNEVLKKLAEAGNEMVNQPGFAEELQTHFNRLPTRYALDVNTERAEDVLTHKNLLLLAETPENRPAFHVRAVHILPVSSDVGEWSPRTIEEEPSPLSSPMQYLLGGLSGRPPKINVHPPPSFGSTPNLQDLALEINHKHKDSDNDQEDSGDQGFNANYPHAPMHEVCFSTVDKPKLLSQLSSLLADVGLNIREAHVFSTVDGYSLDVFVVDGWPTEDTKELGEELERILANMEDGVWLKSRPASPKKITSTQSAVPSASDSKLKTDTANDWEIDNNQLKLGQKVASGAFGDLLLTGTLLGNLVDDLAKLFEHVLEVEGIHLSLPTSYLIAAQLIYKEGFMKLAFVFRGTYCGQDVAIKILKRDRLSETLQHEFMQEIFIMRKIRHKNVVQFIGACTKPPNLSIVTEFMSGGSVYDFLHKHKALLKLPMILRVALDISKGMDYLHQNNIIHRDLKAANLLMDENEVVKVADFGVARVQDQRGIMTAETGTYRWMAPEVIEHKTYDRKVDVFSFGIVLWELLTGRLPYADLTPLQAAVGVVQKGLRPTIPKHTNPKIAELLERCWKSDPALRPEFAEITVILQEILKEAGDDERKGGDQKKGFLSALKRTAGNR